MSENTPQYGRYYTISIDEIYTQEFEDFCKSVNIKKKDFVPMALKYFKAQGINPTKHDNPKSEIEKVTKRLDQFFAFFKKQESDLIKPLFVEIQNNLLALDEKQKALEELTRKSHRLILEEINKK